METIAWLAVVAVVAVALRLAAPYHDRLIRTRPKVEKHWD
jgi:hypothetical protein